MSLTDSQLSLLKNDHTVYPALNITQKNDIENALKTNGLVIQYLKMPTKRQKNLALENTPEALAFVSDIDEEIINEAISSEPVVIKYVSEPSVYQQLLAISLFGPAYHSIASPSDEAKILAALKNEIQIPHTKQSKKELSLHHVYLLCASFLQIQKFQDLFIGQSQVSGNKKNIKSLIELEIGLSQQITDYSQTLFSFLR